MTKGLKTGLIWGATALVAGGIAAGIAIPVVNAKNKVNKIAPLDMDKNSEIFSGFKVSEIQEIAKNAGVKDSSILNKVEYQLAFYLYDQEQKGSIELQKDYLEWDKVSLTKDLRTYAKAAPLGITDDLSSVEWDALLTKIQERKDSATNALTDSQKKSVDTKIADFKDKWTKLNEKITKLKNLDINNPGSFFDNLSDYSKILRPISKIRSDKSKIYDDTKKSFTGSYSTSQEGEREWAKKLVSDYNGATTKDEALDFMVHQDVQQAAFARYKFTINSDFTYEQYKSGVFRIFKGKDALVHANANIDPVTGKGEKVYFLSTGSKIIENAIPGNELLNKLGSNFVGIQNAIIGFKQGKTNPNEGWSIDKATLIKLLSGLKVGSANVVAADKYNEIFDTGKEDLTKQIINFGSGTTDSTQYNSGDLGIMSNLDAFKMVPGFSLGMISILDKQTFKNADAITHLMEAIKTSLEKVAKEKAWTIPAVDNIEEYNKVVSDLINALSDDEIKYYFGIPFRSAMNGINTNSKANGIPTAIRLDSGSEASGKYLVYGEEYGLHYISVKTSSDLTVEVGKELKEAADKQDPSKITTKFDQLLNNYYTQPKILADILKIENGVIGSLPQDLIDFINSHKSELGFKEEDYATATGDKFEAFKLDVIKLIESLKLTENIKNVDATIKDTYFTYLEGRIDNHLQASSEIDANTILPEEIYEAAYRHGGN